ncbi:Putative N-acetylgalactosaminyl-diphosphoundecaprenol glucuronosyltransferase [hydrothermal vent metagenome]|uniref:Putative N-acetylgalactosaminyl-diphosphoundecaprenol glucuronosyltransferase n=1 Tax=hydrothermal vent metagenome TaxID=652676 RepID=A0A1W1BT45_9ZZZZ
MVSIITPSHNASKFISECINSVLIQTYREWEMIIVDDLSTDNSVTIIKEFVEKDKRVKLIELKKNGGPAKARNIAIKESKGDFIAFLDADDLWKKEKLERQLDFMKKYNLAFTYSSYDVIDEEGEYMTTFNTKNAVTYKSLLKTCSIGCLTAIYDVNKLGKVYMPDMQKRQDYALWLDIFKRIDHAKGILEPLASYRVGQTSVSSNKFTASIWQWKIYRDVEKLNIFKSGYYFAHYVYYGLKKYK